MFVGLQMVQETELLCVEISPVTHLLLLSTMWLLYCVPVEIYDHVQITHHPNFLMIWPVDFQIICICVICTMALHLAWGSLLLRKTLKLKLQKLWCQLSAYVFLFVYLSENTLIRTRLLTSEYSDPCRLR